MTAMILIEGVRAAVRLSYGSCYCYLYFWARGCMAPELQRFHIFGTPSWKGLCGVGVAVAVAVAMSLLP